ERPPGCRESENLPQGWEHYYRWKSKRGRRSSGRAARSPAAYRELLGLAHCLGACAESLARPVRGTADKYPTDATHRVSDQNPANAPEKLCSAVEDQLQKHSKRAGKNSSSTNRHTQRRLPR